METNSRDKRPAGLSFFMVGSIALSTVWDSYGLDPVKIKKVLQEVDRLHPWVRRGSEESAPEVRESYRDHERLKFQIIPKHSIRVAQMYAFHRYIKNLAAGLAECPALPTCVSRIGYWIESRSEATEFFTEAGDRRHTDLRVSHWA